MALHRAGDLDAAQALYSQVLSQCPEQADALHLSAVVKYQQGDIAEAGRLFRRTIEVAPTMAEAFSNLGNVLADQGRPDDAIEAYEQALVLRPDLIEAQSNLGNLLRLKGDLENAEKAYRKALEINPGFADAHNNLGALFKEQGRLDDALAACLKAIELAPDSASAYNNLGHVLIALRRYQQAINAFEQALKRYTDFPEALFGLGNALYPMKRFKDAIEVYRKVIALRPDFAEAINNLGNSLSELGKLEEAESCFRKAIRLKPDYAEAYNNLGNTLQFQGKKKAALAPLKKAISLDPGYAEAYNNLGKVLVYLSRPYEALEPLRKALALKADFVAAIYNQGYAFNELGKRQKAYAKFREVLRLKPAWHQAHSTLLMSLGYDPNIDEELLFEEHKLWGERHALPLANRIKPHENDCEPQRPLRLGYISADFGNHPVSHMIFSTLAARDRGQFKVHLYSGRVKEDEMTRQFQKDADVWRSIAGVRDDDLATMIRKDRIDILVDLSGHTAGGRLPVFARKPAPVQATWIGYCDTTGVAAIDYVIMDPLTAPESTQKWFVEKVVRLPDTRFCYTPPEYAPRVADLPASKNHFITFGSFNNLLKVTPAVVGLWCQVLRAVPDSRMIIKWPTLREPQRSDDLRWLFSSNGIAPSRVDIRSANASPEAVLADYARIDIALDTFPYSGGITTCEALWMGVPVVTMMGRRPVSRQCGSIVTAAGCGDLIASDEAEFVRIAARLATDPQALEKRRKDQRDRVMRSALCDAPRFALQLESAFREMWRRWCDAGC